MKVWGRDVRPGDLIELNGKTYRVHSSLDGVMYRDLVTDKGILTIRKGATYNRIEE